MNAYQIELVRESTYGVGPARTTKEEIVRFAVLASDKPHAFKAAADLASAVNERNSNSSFASAVKFAETMRIAMIGERAEYPIYRKQVNDFNRNAFNLPIIHVAFSVNPPREDQ